MSNASKEDVLNGFNAMLNERKPKKTFTKTAGSTSQFANNVQREKKDDVEENVENEYSNYNDDTDTQKIVHTTEDKANAKKVADIENDLMSAESVKQDEHQEVFEGASNINELMKNNPITQIRDALCSIPALELLGLIMAIVSILNATSGNNLTLSAVLMLLAICAHVVGHILYTKPLDINTRTGEGVNTRKSQHDYETDETSENEE